MSIPQQIINKINNDFKETCKEVIKNGDFSVLVPFDNRWSTKIPHQNSYSMVLVIKDWSYENTYIKNDRLFITTAFGETESSASFSFDEILGILTEDMKPILMRSFKQNKKVSIYDFIKEEK